MGAHGRHRVSLRLLQQGDADQGVVQQPHLAQAQRAARQGQEDGEDADGVSWGGIGRSSIARRGAFATKLQPYYRLEQRLINMLLHFVYSFIVHLTIIRDLSPARERFICKHKKMTFSY